MKDLEEVRSSGVTDHTSPLYSGTVERDDVPAFDLVAVTWMSAFERPAVSGLFKRARAEHSYRVLAQPHDDMAWSFHIGSPFEPERGLIMHPQDPGADSPLDSQEALHAMVDSMATSMEVGMNIIRTEHVKMLQSAVSGLVIVLHQEAS